MRLRRTRWCGLWSRRPRVRVPSLTLFVPAIAICFGAVDRAQGNEALDYASVRDLVVLTDDEVAALEAPYEDVARKVVGVGSVGTEAMMVLLMGDREDDPLFLQFKEANTSVLAPYAGASEYEHQGERVVHGQRLMQAASDAFLGWITGSGERRHEFYVRQLRDMKGSAAVETMPPARLALYGQLCGATLARAHARTGDAAKITGYLGDADTFDDALERFAVAYADQNDADYAVFAQAAEDHRIEVERGV